MSDESSVPEREETATTAKDLPARPTLVERPRLARWVALAGLVGVVIATKTLVLPAVPEDHDVVLTLPSPANVVGVDLTWSAPGNGEDILTTSLHFPVGAAPSSLRTIVHLPNGPYEVAIAVERTSGVDSTRRRITLDSSARTTIPLR